jgi:uncharacterized protein YjiS (DUF1127 family)
MRMVGTASAGRFKHSAHLSHIALLPTKQRQRVHRLTLALQLLDDRALVQLGLDRTEIERFAQAAVTCEHRSEIRE